MNPPDTALRPHLSERLWTIGLTALGLLLRLYGLGRWSFWADEVFTVRDALRFPSSLTINPLPYGLVAVALRIGGVSEWSARSVPMLFGVAAIPLTDWVGRRWIGTWGGRMGALFVALSPWHLFWSQNARHYSFVFFFGLLAVWLFHEALERDRIGLSLASLGSLLALVLSHLLAGALLIGLGLYVLIAGLRRGLPPRWKRHVGAVFGPFLIAGAAVLLHPQAREYLFAGWGRTVWARNPAYVLATFVYGLTVPIAVAAVFGAILAVREESPSRRRGGILLLCALGGPLVFFLAAALVQNVAGYYLFVLAPFGLLLAGWACGALIQRQELGLLRWLASLVLVGGLFHGLVVYYGFEQGGRPDWRTALSQLQRQLRPDDLVWMTLPDVGRYYLDHPDERILKITHADLNDPERFRAKRTSGNVYVVVDANNFQTVDPDRRVRSWIDRHGRRVAVAFGYARGADRTVEVFRLDPPERPPR